MANNPNVLDNLKPFVKGDKRINRKGRPKSFDAVRKLAIQIAGEQAGQTELTRVQLMLTAMASSKNPSDRKLFLEYAFGKVKDEVQLSGEIGTKVIIEYSQGEDTSVTPSTVGSKEQPEEV